MADKDLRYSIDADDGPLGAALVRAGGHLGVFNARMDGVFGGLQQHFGNIQGLIGRLAGLLTAGELVNGMRRAIDLQDEMSEGAQRLGLSTEAYSEYAYAAKLSGLETGEMGKAVAKLSSTLTDAQQGQKQAVDLFRRLKLDPQQIKDADALLLALSDRFAGMRDGVGKTALAVDVFGEKLGPKLVPLLNEGREGITALREEARALGIVVDTEAGKAAEKFNDDLDRLKIAGNGVFNTLARELLPSLVAVSGAMVESAKEGSALGVIAAGIRTVFETVAVVGANVAFVFKGVGRELGALAAQAVAIGTLDIDGFNAISDAVKEDGVRARAELDALERRILGIGKGEGADDLRELARRGRKVPGYGSAADADPFKPLGKVPTADKEKKAEFVGPQAPGADFYEAQLTAARLAAAQQGELRDMTKAEEADYWRDVLQNHAVSAAGRLQITRRITGLELETYREQAAQQRALGDGLASHAEDMALARVDADQQAAELQAQVGAMSQAQLLEQDQLFEERRNQIRQQALQARLATLDPERDPVQYQQITQQIEVLEEQHQQRMAQIRGLALQQTQASSLQIAGSLQQGFAGVFAQIGTSIRTIGDLVRGMGQVVLQTFVQMLAQMAAKWLVNKLLMKAISKAAAVGEITAEAGKAGAAGIASWAGAPWPINAGAPAFGAAMSAAAMGFAPMASARDGFDIPAGVNPITQLHEREMVLPQAQADAVRDMAAGGGASSAAPVFNGVSPSGYLVAHKSEFVRFFKSLQRDFDL